jgi:hypothetical protein
LAASVGIPECSLYVRGAFDGEDRVAGFAASSLVHDGVIVDGGMPVDADPDALADSLERTPASTASVERLGVLAADRGRAFSRRESADRVWQLHVDLSLSPVY